MPRKCIGLVVIALAISCREVQTASEPLTTSTDAESTGATASFSLIGKFKAYASEPLRATSGSIAASPQKVFVYWGTQGDVNANIVAGNTQGTWRPAVPAPLKNLRAENGVTGVAYVNGKLVVAKKFDDLRPISAQKKLKSKLLLSRDEGRTFEQLDSTPFYRKESTPFGDLITEAFVDQIEEQTIGGKPSLVVNIFDKTAAYSSYVDGRWGAWQSLVSGIPIDPRIMGYTTHFGFIGNLFFSGGEHPLDIAYLGRGTVSEAGAVSVLTPVQVNGLDNRRVQFIKGVPSKPDTVIAGVENGFMVSHDRGETFTFGFEDPPGTQPTPARKMRVGPYMTHIVTSQSEPLKVIIGGQPNSGGELGTVVVSCDGGQSWKDVSADLLPRDAFVGLAATTDLSGQEHIFMASHRLVSAGNATADPRYSKDIEVREINVACTGAP